MLERREEELDVAMIGACKPACSSPFSTLIQGTRFREADVVVEVGKAALWSLKRV